MWQSEVGGVRVKKCKWKLGVVIDFTTTLLVFVKDVPASNDPLNGH